MSINDTVIVGAFGTAFTVLTGTVAVMWRVLSSEHKRLQKRADSCEADRATLFEKVAKLTGDAEMLARCPAGEGCPMRGNMRPGSGRIPKIQYPHEDYPTTAAAPA